MWLRHARRGHGEMLNDPGFVDAICAAVPSCPAPEEVARHIQWYRQYTTLVDARRAAVQAWRLERDTIRPPQNAPEHRSNLALPVRKVMSEMHEASSCVVMGCVAVARNQQSDNTCDSTIQSEKSFFCATVLLHHASRGVE